METLRQGPILESFAQTMTKPSLLWYVPSTEFTDADGIPFTLNFATASRYLSSKYPEWTIDSICSLGVRRLSPQEFLQDLRLTIDTDTENFQTRPPTWHTQLAKSLIPLTIDSDHRSSLKDLRLIPLQDGSWTSAHGSLIYFSDNANYLELLGDLEVLVVDLAAGADTSRRNLFSNLGVKNLEVSEICRQISEMHTASSFDPRSLTRAQLISQVKFLHRASWQIAKNVDLWFATSTDERCLGRNLYMPEDFGQDTPATRVFNQLQSRFPTIHEDYLAAFTADEDWRPWISKSLGLSSIPRLVSGNGSSKTYHMSEEFEFIFKECRSSDILYVLVANWNEYCSWIEGSSSRIQGKEVSESRYRLREDIRAAIVQCSNGSVPLRETVLPGLDLFMEEHFSIPVLQLEDVSNRRWAMLSHFDVPTKPDVHYYLSCLHGMKDVNPRREKMGYLYERLQQHYDGNEDLIWHGYPLPHPFRRG